MKYILVTYIRGYTIHNIDKINYEVLFLCNYPIMNSIKNKLNKNVWNIMKKYKCNFIIYDKNLTIDNITTTNELIQKVIFGNNPVSLLNIKKYLPRVSYKYNGVLVLHQYLMNNYLKERFKIENYLRNDYNMILNNFNKLNVEYVIAHEARNFSNFKYKIHHGADTDVFLSSDLELFKIRNVVQSKGFEIGNLEDIHILDLVASIDTQNSKYSPTYLKYIFKNMKKIKVKHNNKTYKINLPAEEDAKYLHYIRYIFLKNRPLHYKKAIKLWKRYGFNINSNNEELKNYLKKLKKLKISVYGDEQKYIDHLLQCGKGRNWYYTFNKSDIKNIINKIVTIRTDTTNIYYKGKIVWPTLGKYYVFKQLNFVKKYN